MSLVESPEAVLEWIESVERGPHPQPQKTRVARPVKKAPPPTGERLPAHTPGAARRRLCPGGHRGTIILPDGPLAAYQLGCTSRLVPMYIERSAPRRAGGGGVDAGVDVAIDELAESLLALTEEVPGNIFGELRRAIAASRHLVREPPATPANTDRPVETGSVPRPFPGEVLRRRLCEPADVALDAWSLLRKFYDLGAAVGSYRLMLKRHEARFGTAYDLDRLPRIDGLVGRLEHLPGSCLEGIPALGSLTYPIPRLREYGQGEYLRTLLASDPALRGHEGVGVDSTAVEQLLLGVDHAIRVGLDYPGAEVSASALAAFVLVADDPARPGSHASAASTSGTKPRWDSDEGLLYFGARIARRVARQAVRIRSLLDVFQEREWPEEIIHPLDEFKSSVGYSWHINEWTRSLNTRLELIRFRSNNLGNGLRWERLPRGD